MSGCHRTPLHVFHVQVNELCERTYESPEIAEAVESAIGEFEGGDGRETVTGGAKARIERKDVPDEIAESEEVHLR